MIYNLIEFFEKANRTFVKDNIHFFDYEVSERSICGGLSQVLYDEIKNTDYNTYHVDVEYNRNYGGKVKTMIKNDNFEKVTIVCDLIIHSRGENETQDNLIAIEMKKRSTSSKRDRAKDKARLIALTGMPNETVWNYEGDVFPEDVCGYILGIYYEVIFREKKIYIEYYVEGEKLCSKCFSYDTKELLEIESFS